MGKRLKELLAQGKVTRVFGVGQLCDPKIVEMVGYSGHYDAVWLDQEHTGITTAQIESASRAARASGLDSFVRLAATDYATVMRALEAGAGGVMAAMVKTVREVQDVVHWARFHPEGGRGVNGTGVDGRYGTLTLAEYFRRANAETFVAIQIEHADAVEVVEQIAAVPGVDVLFVGPADLSQSLGVPGEWEHPKLWEAIERVAAAAREHGIHWAVLPITAAFARRCVALDCRMLSLGLDVWAFQKGLAATRAGFADYYPDV